MWLIYLALATLALDLGECTTTWRPPADFECPLDDDGMCIGARYPYPYDCELYYRCFAEYDCVVYTFYCPVGLHFNAHLSECVAPSLANCTVSTTPQMTTLPMETTQPVDVTTEVPESQTTEAPESLTTEAPESLTTEVPERPTTDVPERPTTEVTERPTTEVPESQTTEASESLTTEAPESPTTEVPERPTTEVPERPTTEVPESQTTEAPGSPTTEAPTTTEETTTEPMTTTAPTTTQPPVTEGDGVIFFATRTSDWSGSNPVLLFDDTRVNIGQRFQDGFSFTANNSGLHFFSLSAGALAHTETILSLTDIKPARGNIRRESTANSGDDVIYRNTIVNLDRDQAITVEAMTVLASNGDDALISWGGFSFDDLFVDPVVFSAGRDSEYRPDSPTKHIIELPDVFVNQGDSFIEDSSQFKAPEDGIYYFTFSIGQINGDPARVALGVQRVTDADNEAEIICGQGNTNDLNIQSRSTVVQLEEGDLVWISTLNPSVYSDPDDYQTSLSGFKYSPSKASQVAWSVHRLWPWSGNPGVSFDPIEFTSVAVNVGEVYNEASDVFEISVSGYYFLEFNVGVLGGAEAGRPTYVKLIKGGEPENESNLGEVLASVVHEAVAENNDNVGRSLITLLEAGDVIRLAADENTGIFSDSERQTTFLGLLLLEV